MQHVKHTPSKKTPAKNSGYQDDYQSYAPIGFQMPSEPPLILYVYDEIGPPVDYVEFVHTLRYAAPDQEIIIHINSPGGHLSSCLSIINAIGASEGNITTVVDGDAYSAAAMIWLAGHTKAIASPHVSVMVHGASVGFNPAKTSDINNSNKATDKIIEGLLDDLAVGFLTTQEREDIRKGVDVYLVGSEIIDRLPPEEEVD